MGKKNRDETMRKLIDAVGEILKEKGYAGLGINRIALRAGVSKELIYRYFEGLNNLVKIYIHSKDYWLPLFDKIQTHPSPGKDQVLDTFIALFQEQFRFFFQEPEMQKFILWQISEVNPLMRSISEKRETEGAKLLALTEDHFRDSGINFKAVAALLLGGIYYVVLHASANKSTVAGIDANLERDREEILKTIEQILVWAWEAAAQKKSQ
ncbi:TetR/AcrR family transcriptional regulator [Mucilaginibacter mali]|uniref:TetR/AcrR family transcriptional regulator n=1 Tax=Mucilaginibacter mali TaxID=2740462 RepID=A0A7D4QFY6_9SPHI|nr:TetR/AcrR family transcriptional regulator [Mucilaginibacter mali]QKJ32844.1 TetR/AcrR family transcriptional regulator [Mucilaginibacter mali]